MQLRTRGNSATRIYFLSEGDNISADLKMQLGCLMPAHPLVRSHEVVLSLWEFIRLPLNKTTILLMRLFPTQMEL